MTELRTERLITRPYRADEADLLGLLMRDRRVFFWRTGKVGERDIADVLARSLAVRDAGLGWFAVFRKDDRRFVGNVVLQPLSGSEEVEIGYHFVPEAWGRGYATEAASALLDYGFRALRLKRIVAIALPENVRSQRVLERLGMSYIEDRIRADLQHRYFALSRLDYLAAQKAVADQPGT